MGRSVTSTLDILLVPNILKNFTVISTSLAYFITSSQAVICVFTDICIYWQWFQIFQVSNGCSHREIHGTKLNTSNASFW